MDLKLLALPFAFAFIAFASAYLVIKGQVCLHYGRALASDEFLKINPSGYQDALTDPSTNKLFFLVQSGLVISIVAFFYFFPFWVGAGSIVSYFFAMFILKRLLPPFDSPKWAAGLYATLARREADYKRDGDELRYQATKEFREMFERKILLL